MTIYYRAVLRVGDERLGPRLRSRFAGWAGVDDDGTTRSERARGRTRVLLTDDEGCGRYRFEQPSGAGRLSTTATWARAPRADRGWVAVEIDGDLDGDADPVRAPTFVADFLRAARATDGAIPMNADPTVVGVDRIDRLTAWLTDPDRTVPIVVLSVERSDPAVVAGHAELIADRLAGVAAVVRLADVRAQELLNRRLGEALMVYGGGLRTYMPGLDLDSETRPDRHPVRGGGAIRDQGVRALAVVLGDVTEQSARRRLSADVRRTATVVERVLDHGADPSALDAEPPSPAALARAEHARPSRPEPDGPEPPTARERAPDVLDGLAERVSEQVAGKIADGLLEAMVDTARAGDSETTRMVRSMSAHVSALTHAIEGSGAARARPSGGDPRHRELERLRKDYDQLEFDYELLLEQERHTSERLRWLEGRLAEHADPVYGVEAPAQVWDPDSLMEVLMRARERLPRVDLPDGLDADAAKLDVTYPRESRRWTGKTWDALRALDAYAASRAEGRFTGGFYDWCTRPVQGRPAIPPAMVSMKESDSVSARPKFRDARTFHVPDAVDPSGLAYMPSHIKLRRGGNPAPRMHFLDDAGGATGRIWVGYLGDHLPNTHTN